jgi:hypothetical protein
MVLAVQPVVLDHQVLAFDVAGFVEAFAERSDIAYGVLGRPAVDEADDGRRLLRLRRDRPHRRAAKQRDEFAAVHGCPLLRLRAAHYHTVAEERRCASQQKLRDDVADGVKISHCGDVGCTTAFPPRTDIRRHA